MKTRIALIAIAAGVMLAATREAGAIPPRQHSVMSYTFGDVSGEIFPTKRLRPFTLKRVSTGAYENNITN